MFRVEMNLKPCRTTTTTTRRRRRRREDIRNHAGGILSDTGLKSLKAVDMFCTLPVHSCLQTPPGCSKNDGNEDNAYARSICRQISGSGKNS